MYLVTPTQLLWTNIGHISPEKIIELGGNLEAITDWQVASRPVFDSDVEVALRRGIPVSNGIVVDAIWILDQERPRELREVHARAKRAHEHPQIQATTDFIDKYLATGYREYSDDLDRRVDESAARSIREAEAEARRQLEEPVKDELVAHWRSLRGHVPGAIN